MKITIQNPQYECHNPEKTLHPYNWYILNKYTKNIFIYNLDFNGYKILIIWIIKNKINIFKFKWIFSIKTLNKHSDILISFNWRPDYDFLCPPLDYKWLKFVHIMDYFVYTKNAYNNLVKNEIDYVLWYNNHWIYDDYFKSIYKNYINKCISVPFSFANRFKNINNFKSRINKCVALWAVNFINDNNVINWELDDAKEYFNKKNEVYFHKFRNMLVENEELLSNEIDSLLINNWKNWNYNIVDKYNEYKMFTTCESIMNFPSVKTYEWMACWSVFVASDNPCYDEIWLIDWINCIKYKQYDIIDFKNKVIYYQNNPELLEQISINWYNHVIKNYNPEKTALDLFNIMKEIHEKWNINFNTNTNIQ